MSAKTFLRFFFTPDDRSVIGVEMHDYHGMEICCDFFDPVFWISRNHNKYYPVRIDAVLANGIHTQEREKMVCAPSLER
jgi:hypothetical protein